jgi:hypothetical protein
MVKNEKQHSEEIRAPQGSPADRPEPYKIAASTPFDFGAKNLTPYGGLFPVATMLEKRKRRTNTPFRRAEPVVKFGDERRTQSSWAEATRASRDRSVSE